MGVLGLEDVAFAPAWQDVDYVPRRVVALVPARGGSKGIPHKNLAKIGKQTLLDRTISQGLKECDSVVVSSEDGTILAHAEQCGAAALRRPPQLSEDDTPTEAVIDHFLKSGHYEHCNIVLLQCTSPFREPGDISVAVSMLLNFDTVLSVVADHTFTWEKHWDNSGHPLNYHPHARPRRQDIRQYRENGSVYCFTQHTFRRYGNRLGGKIGLYVMDEKCGIQIDTPFDLAIANMMAEKWE